jgi:putative Mg2+ transporter-C (MgtC) family protein
MNILASSQIVLDPSRVAAQVVSGIGFIGGGVIFMRRDVVRGLTTAASIWLTAALGMACGAGLVVLAVATTLGHFVIMLVFPRVVHVLPHPRRTTNEIYISYEGGRELLRTILIRCTEIRFAISHVQLDRGRFFSESDDEARDRADDERVELEPRSDRGIVTLRMRVRGKRPISHLIATLSDIDGIREVGVVTDEAELD